MKILHIDIETAPSKGYFWGLWDQNIAINQIVEPGYTLCFAARWDDSGPIMFESIHHTTTKRMVQRAWELLDQADVVSHYNGKKFDIPTLNREFILNGLEPPSKFKELDLLQVVRQRFKFQSNKLDYVSQQLGLGSKVHHKGMELWKDCMAGDEKAWGVMRRYNMQDVALLQKLYKRLLPWISTHPNWGPYLDDTRPTCRNCGSTHVIEKGVEHTNTGSYKRYKCKTCGTPLRGRKAIKPASEGILV